jgi:hypothetical protein
MPAGSPVLSLWENKFCTYRSSVYWLIARVIKPGYRIFYFFGAMMNEIMTIRNFPCLPLFKVFIDLAVNRIR